MRPWNARTTLVASSGEPDHIHDGVEMPRLRHLRLESRVLLTVTMQELRAVRNARFALAPIVERDLIATLQKLGRDRSADQSRSPNDKYLHFAVSLFRIDLAFDAISQSYRQGAHEGGPSAGGP